MRSYNWLCARTEHCNAASYRQVLPVPAEKGVSASGSFILLCTQLTFILQVAALDPRGPNDPGALKSVYSRFISSLFTILTFLLAHLLPYHDMSLPFAEMRWQPCTGKTSARAPRAAARAISLSDVSSTRKPRAPSGGCRDTEVQAGRRKATGRARNTGTRRGRRERTTSRGGSATRRVCAQP